jgi:cysteinyl-tRNA synthetase
LRREIGRAAAERPLTLTIYNTLTRRKEPFEPIDPENVRMYVCGPTVYDFAHIGNARPVVVFDVLYRLLRYMYGEDHVTYVRNITDVDDKIIAAAKETGEAISAITERFTDAFHADMGALNALPPDVEPRATAHIPEMIALIETLIAGGNAYAAEGHVLFAVSSMADYGKLSRHSRAELIDGARVEVAPYKKDPADFVLWKPSDDDQPGWDSPWGFGRPGWHLECSAMSEKHLGVPFDIHGGGRDLIFPHHENEIAQSRCAHGGGEFARSWMHNGYLTVEGEKMSKSLGNFFTVRDLLAKAPGEAIRYNMLGTHYRQPADWTDAGLEEAKSIMDTLYQALRSVHDVEAEPAVHWPEKLLEVLQDDLNTPLVRGVLRNLARELNKATSDTEKAALKGQLLAAGKAVGLLQQDPEDWFKKSRADVSGSESGAGPSDDEVLELITARADARASKDFGRADSIRAELADAGVILEDRPDGTTDWRRI